MSRPGKSSPGLRQAALMALAAILCTGCSPADRRQGGRDEAFEGPVAQESWDVVLQISERGVIRLVLDAAHMVRYEHPDSVHTLFERGEDGNDRVTATFYDSTGAKTGTLSAESVLFDEEAHTMVATGDVVLESNEGRKLKSEEVFWDKDSRTIEAPHFVSLTTEDQHIRGYELVADEDLKTWSLSRPTGTVTIREPS